MEAQEARYSWLRLFGPSALFLGATSFLYHASYTFFFQFWDFVGMFAFASLPIVINMVRLRLIRPEQVSGGGGGGAG